MVAQQRELRDALSRWDKPALVAFSDSDPVFPFPKAGDRYVELIPTVEEQVRIEGAAHFLQEDRGRADRGGDPQGSSPAMATAEKARKAPRPRRLKPLRELSRDQWKTVGKRAYERFGEVELTDRAATLAYYGFLSLFPALIVAVALLALFGSYPETYNSIIDTLREAAPGTAVDTIDSALRDVLQGRGAGSLLGIGLLFAFITASGAVGAAIRALEAINQTRESASFVRSNLTRLWLTLALMALFLIAFASLLVAGPIFGSIAEAAGLGDTGRTDRRRAALPGRDGGAAGRDPAALLARPGRHPPAPRSSTCRAPCSPRSSGCSPRPASRSTSPTSAPMTRPTGRSAR